MLVGIKSRPREGKLATYMFGASFTDAELSIVLDDMGAMLTRARDAGEKMGFLSISYDESRMTAKQRSRVASWVSDHTPLMLEACACMSIVVPGAMQRGAFSAILWLVDYPVPIRAFPTEAEASAWARAMLGMLSVEAPTPQQHTTR